MEKWAEEKNSEGETGEELELRKKAKKKAEKARYSRTRL
jgi:hypothetical protein